MSQMASFINQLPRFNFAFRQTSVLNGFTNDYFQSVIVWSCVPLLLCLLFLTIILIVWSTKCCAPKSVPPKCRNNFRATHRCLTALILLSCICLAVSLLSNETINRGVQHISSSSTFVRRQSFDAIQKVRRINQTLFSTVTDKLEKLKSGLQNLRTIQKNYLGADTWILRINEVELAVANASTNLDPVIITADDYGNLVEFGRTLDRYEFERWILFGSLLTIIFIVMLSSITTICMRSKKATVLFGAIGIFMFILCWTIVGAAVAFTLVLADFCIHPVPFLMQNLRTNLGKAQLDFYSNCTISTSFESPLHNHLKYVESSLEQVPVIMNGVSCLLGQSAAEGSSSIIQILKLCHEVQGDFYDLLKSLGRLEDVVGCNMVRFERETLQKSLCFWSMYGSVVILGASTLFGVILFFVLVFLKRAWRSFGDVKGESTSTTAESYEQDPFLVTAEQTNIPADFYGSHVSNPRTRFGPSESVIGTTSGQNRGDSSPVWRSTPPPAYESVPLLRTQVRQHRM